HTVATHPDQSCTRNGELLDGSEAKERPRPEGVGAVEQPNHRMCVIETTPTRLLGVVGNRGVLLTQGGDFLTQCRQALAGAVLAVMALNDGAQALADLPTVLHLPHDLMSLCRLLGEGANGDERPSGAVLRLGGMVA